MRDKKNRYGINEVIRKAEAHFHAQVGTHLTSEEYEEYRTNRNSFVAGLYPQAKWSEWVDFEPDRDFYYEVVFAIAAPPRLLPRVFARILISRDRSEDFIHVRWNPDAEDLHRKLPD